MSPLARAIYSILSALVPAAKPELSYADLVAQLPAPHNGIPADSQLLFDALGELVTACRDRHLPAISAMVVRYRERVPGPGYYKVAHPAVADDIAKAMVAWGTELEQVRRTKYPVSL